MPILAHAESLMLLPVTSAIAGRQVFSRPVATNLYFPVPCGRSHLANPNRSRARNVRLAGKVDASCQSSRTLRASCSHLYPAQRSLRAQLLDGRFFSRPVVLSETSPHAHSQSTRLYHLYPAQRSQRAAQLLDGRFSLDPLSSVKPRLMRIHKVQGNTTCIQHKGRNLPRNCWTAGFR
jgi:hypothetical protein